MVLSTLRSRRRTAPLAAALALAWLAIPSALWAFECRTVDSNDLPRDCTSLEATGKCMWEAGEARKQCVEASGLFGWWRCNEDYALDMAACALVSPFRVIVK